MQVCPVFLRFLGTLSSLLAIYPNDLRVPDHVEWPSVTNDVQ